MMEKMKRSMALLLTAMLMLTLLAGCGNSSSARTASAAADSAAAPAYGYWDNGAYDAPAEEEYVYAETESTAGSVPERGAKIIYTADLSLETTDFDEADGGIDALVEKLGGYYQEKSVSTYSGDYRYAHYTIRIPAKNFNELLDSVGTLCQMNYCNRYSDDVSEVYYDTDARLTTYKTKLERLQHLLSEAENMEDIITIESAISETEMVIEQLSGTLRNYDARVDYSTVNISLEEVYRLSDVMATPTTLGEKMANAFSSGIADAGEAIEDFLVWLAYSWIGVLFWAAVIVAFVCLLRHRKSIRLPKLRRRKKNADTEEKTDN